MLILGSQYRWSKNLEGLDRFLEKAPIPAYLSGMARGALPKNHPSLFRRSRSKALARADLVIVAGTPLDFRLGYGEKIPAEAKLVQIDLDGGEIGRNRKVDIGIVGDVGHVLHQIAEALDDPCPACTDWRLQLGEIEDRIVAGTAKETESDAEPINPMRLCAEINRFIDDKTIVIGDGGDFVATASYILDVEGMGSWMDPGPLGTLGVGPGYAMAAKLAKPGSTVVLIMGDGSFGFNGMEFESMVRQGIKVVGIIGNDAAWTQILRGQAMIYGEDRIVATKLDYTRYDKVVEGLGGHGEYVEKLDDLYPALKRAFESDKAALVNVKIGGSDFRKYAMSV
jgi:acetolactate synthase-1/2/3 large subunit